MMQGYNVGIRLGIVGPIFSDLARVRQNLGMIRGEAERLQKSLVLGGAKLGLGLVGFHAAGKMSRPASEYLHLINMATVGGLRHASVVRMIGDAWKEAGRNSYTTISQNMRALIDARKILGSTSGAFSVLPDIIKLQTAIAGSTDKGLSARSEDITFGALKAIDILGKVRDHTQFLKHLSMMSQAIIWGQGRILPQDFQTAFKYERQSSLGLSSFFQYRILPSLMLEMKGSGGIGATGGPGSMLAAFSRLAVQGIMSRKNAVELQSLGLLEGGMLNTTTVGTIATHVKGSRLAMSNPFQWVQGVFLPALRQKYGNLSNADLQHHIMQTFTGNQLATQLITWFANPDKAGNIVRDAFQIGSSMNYKQASAESLKNDPFVALRSMRSQWSNIGTAMFSTLLKDALPVLRLFTSGLNHLALAMIRFPNVTKAVTLGFIGLSAAMAISGTLTLLRVGFTMMNGVLLKSLTGLTLYRTQLLLTGAVMSGWAAGTLLRTYVPAIRRAGDAVADVIYKILHAASPLGHNGVVPAFRRPGEYIYNWKGHEMMVIQNHVFLDGREISKDVSRHLVNRHNHRTGATNSNPGLSPALGAH